MLKKCSAVSRRSGLLRLRQVRFNSNSSSNSGSSKWDGLHIPSREDLQNKIAQEAKEGARRHRSALPRWKQPSDTTSSSAETEEPTVFGLGNPDKSASAYHRPRVSASTLQPNGAVAPAAVVRIPNAHLRSRKRPQRESSDGSSDTNQHRDQRPPQRDHRRRRRNDDTIMNIEFRRARQAEERLQRAAARQQERAERAEEEAEQTAAQEEDDVPLLSYEHSVNLETGRIVPLLPSQRAFNPEDYLTPADLGELYDKTDPGFADGGAEFQGPWLTGPDFKPSPNAVELFGKKIVSKRAVKGKDYSRILSLAGADFSQPAATIGPIKHAQVAMTHQRDMDTNRSRNIMEIVKSRTNISQ